MQKKVVRILLVEVSEDDALMICQILRETQLFNQYEVDWVSRYDHALNHLLDQPHDVGLFDVKLAERSGLDLLAESLSLRPGMPVILLAGEENCGIEVETSVQGAADFLDKKLLDGAILERSIRYGSQINQRLHSVLQGDKESYWLRSEFPVPGDHGSVMQGLVAVDVTERVHAQEAVRRKSRLLNEIIKVLPVVIGRIDGKGVIVEAEGTGLTREFDGSCCASPIPGRKVSLRSRTMELDLMPEKERG